MKTACLGFSFLRYQVINKKGVVCPKHVLDTRILRVHLFQLAPYGILIANILNKCTLTITNYIPFITQLSLFSSNIILTNIFMSH